MIIFDLDGTLALIDHRRHFVTRPQIIHSLECTPEPCWRPDWKAFYEACENDKPNHPIISLFRVLHSIRDVKIWSARCESVRYKTLKWLKEYTHYGCDDILKMRPVGDYTPDEQLKEKWLDEAIINHPVSWSNFESPIEMVFDDRQKVVDMWRRRGITCLQVAKGDF